MIRKVFLFCVFSYGFAVFGSIGPEKPAVSSGTASVEADQAVSGTSFDKGPSAESGSTLPDKVSAPFSPQQLTYYEALKKYRETARLEWKWGMGVSVATATGYADFIHSPLLLELQMSFAGMDERLKGLIQAGGMYIVNTQNNFDYLLFPLQAGLKYSFSHPYYVSLRGGPLFPVGGAFPPPLTGELALGFENDVLTMEIALQRLMISHTGRLTGVGWEVVFSIGGVLKKWWVER